VLSLINIDIQKLPQCQYGSGVLAVIDESSGRHYSLISKSTSTCSRILGHTGLIHRIFSHHWQSCFFRSTDYHCNCPSVHLSMEL